ncbi:hypothetical protein FH972_022969 [Carpinus fangiana]|uniref:Uncharacterized protein n=1 Tax=Carpinus fangiana TaxID=176857 RepID=A0A5N6KW24_9ROSI|nr:hypothetical protein FH972_022969 [Carpinus fangiana]
MLLHGLDMRGLSKCQARNWCEYDYTLIRSATCAWRTEDGSSPRLRSRVSMFSTFPRMPERARHIGHDWIYCGSNLDHSARRYRVLNPAALISLGVLKASSFPSYTNSNMSRRPHAKSRHGCLRCKRQHVKLKRNYTTPHTTQWTTPPSSAAATTQRQHSAEEPAVDLTQIELFHHFSSSLCDTFMRTPAEGALYHQMITSRAVQNAPLMRQLLAMSALHFSSIRKDQSHFYRDIADSLHSSALSSFNILLYNIDESNCTEALLFGHLIAIYVFCTTFAATPLDDFNASLDNIVGCIKLLQGVSTVMRTWWDVLRHTECGIFVSHSEAYENASGISREELAYLKPLLACTNLRPAAINVCEEALDKLQQFIDIENQLGEESKSTHMAFAWLMVLKADFISLIDERRPEALALLGCYAGLLHKRQSNWAIGQAGRRLLTCIKKCLGRRWDGWLAWPIKVAAEEQTSHSHTP